MGNHYNSKGSLDSASSITLSEETSSHIQQADERIKNLHNRLSQSKFDILSLENVEPISYANSDSHPMESVKFELTYLNSLELVFPFTILVITLLGISLIAIILILWMKGLFRMYHKHKTPIENNHLIKIATLKGDLEKAAIKKMSKKDCMLDEKILTIPTTLHTSLPSPLSIDSQVVSTNVSVSVPISRPISIYPDEGVSKKFKTVISHDYDRDLCILPDSYEIIKENALPNLTNTHTSFLNNLPKLTSRKYESSEAFLDNNTLENFFSFPDVDLPTTESSKTKNISSYLDEKELSMNFQQAVCRTRFKSISLDTESARKDGNKPDVSRELTKRKENLDSNKAKLLLDLKFVESNKHFANQPSIATPKTPTFTKTRQKAISLDSESTSTEINSSDQVLSVSVPTTPEKQQSCYKRELTENYENQNNISIQSSEKSTRFNLNAYNTVHKLYANNKVHYNEHNKIKHSHVFGKKLGSFEENIAENQNISNLQVLKTNTLSLSNNNLKTLPEIMTLSDFSTTQIIKCENKPSIGQKQSNRPTILQRRGSNHSLTLNLDASGSVCNLSKRFSKSNNSLGNSHQNLTDFISNNQSHIPPTLSNNSSGFTNYKKNIDSKKKLLQRRGSNTSLTLNIRNSSSSLNRFDSHSSLNIATSIHEKSVAASLKKCSGLLERRNSNCSLTLNIHSQSLSVSNANLRGSASSLYSSHNNQTEIALDHLCILDNTQEIVNNFDNKRKFLSSENLSHDLIQNQNTFSQSKYGSIDDLKINNKYKENSSRNECIRNITTKPLSPQSTSEDFKIYLANIQFLQNASNILTSSTLRSLNNSLNKKSNTTDNDKSSVLNTIPVQFGNKEASVHLNTLKPTHHNIHQEFWDLPTNYQEKPMVFGSQSKNRYKSILPNEHSRVILNPENNSLYEPYINANYIKVILLEISLNVVNTYLHNIFQKSIRYHQKMIIFTCLI